MRSAFAVIAAAVALAACGAPPAADNAADTAAADEGRAFLARNAEQEGVVVLPSGLQYKVVRSGPESGPHPRPQDEVRVHYEGTTLDGTVFDSTYSSGQPAVFRLGGLIPGWVEGIQLMQPGDEWILYVPPELAYGERGAGPIPPNSTLTFRIELLGVLQIGSEAMG